MPFVHNADLRVLLSLDTSAWQRARHPAVSPQWQSALTANDLGICDRVRLEILWSAQTAIEYEEFGQELSDLPQFSMEGAFARACEVQRLLANKGGLHHRSVKIADLLIAAAAERAGVTVWHYDADFDRIAAVTGQPTEWVAPRGSL